MKCDPNDLPTMVHKHTSRDIAVRIIAAVKLLIHVAQLLDHFTSCIRHTPVGLDRQKDTVQLYEYMYM